MLHNSLHRPKRKIIIESLKRNGYTIFEKIKYSI